MPIEINGAANGSAKPMDILLIGLGAIGTVYSFLLERSGKVRVTAIARSNHNLYAEKGITLQTVAFGTIENYKPYRVFKTQEEALEGDVHYAFCLNCTKYVPDSITTPQLLAPSIASGKVGAWALIQNGLDVEEELYQAVKDLGTPIISGAAWIGVMTSASGDLVSWGVKENLVAGIYPPLDPPSTPQTRRFTEKEEAAHASFMEIVQAGGGTIWREDRITSIRFSKNVWNCAWSTIEGLCRTTPHTFEPLSEQDKTPLKSLIKEIVETGFKSGLLYEGLTQYPDRKPGGNADEVARHCWDVIYGNSSLKYQKGIAPHRMSLLVDLEMGRPIEVECITGAVLRLARAHGIEPPLLAFAYSLLKGTQLETLRRLQGKGAKQ